MGASGRKACGGRDSGRGAALALLAFVTPLATEMYVPGFPRRRETWAADAVSGVQLTLTSFLIGTGLGQLILGPFSDRGGRRKPTLVGSAACVVASVLCALAPSLGWLVALCFLQGFTGAAGVLAGRSLLLRPGRRLFPLPEPARPEHHIDLRRVRLGRRRQRHRSCAAGSLTRVQGFYPASLSRARVRCDACLSVNVFRGQS
ncbi:MFS transporter [Streptomyces klenkii]|uniref:MFS transporter n=1 Tax=Streptomyces klenkii TaxID=1420899 RepID=UPI00340EC33F